MTAFTPFNTQIQKQWDSMKDSTLFVVDITREELRAAYLDSFPKGTNEIYKKRREYDCSCCLNFIYNVGHVVSIDAAYQYITVWDMVDTSPFKEVAAAMAELIKSKPIKGLFLPEQRAYGSRRSLVHEHTAVIEFNHFYVKIPSALASKRLCRSFLLDKSSYNLFKRALEEWPLAALVHVKQCIDSTTNPLYRGEQSKPAIDFFIKQVQEYKAIGKLDNYLWLTAYTVPYTRLYSSSIGTFVTSIAAGRITKEHALRLYNEKVNPVNYQRSTATVGTKAISRLEDNLREAGILPALTRRHMTKDEISIEDCLFVHNKTIDVNVFDSVRSELPVKLTKGTDVSISDFLSNIVPVATRVKVMFTPALKDNLVCLTSSDSDKSIFSWNNNVAWTYINGCTDTVTQRVKRAGGNIDGSFRVSLAWHNKDDLDIWLRSDTYRRKVYYNNKRIGDIRLDVDANCSASGCTITPVENIYVPANCVLPQGNYYVDVDQYHMRSRTNTGFILEIAYGDTKKRYYYNKTLTSRLTRAIVVNVDAHGHIQHTIDPALQEEDVANSKVWGLTTNSLVDVDMITLSPNYWKNKKQGNKHFIFALAGCRTEEPVQSIFNEYIMSDLSEHRKAIEQVSNKLLIEPAQEQLCGIGFSSTLKKEVTCLVELGQGDVRTFNVQI